jgi:hypothetical protein
MVASSLAQKYSTQLKVAVNATHVGKLHCGDNYCSKSFIKQIQDFKVWLNIQRLMKAEQI